MIQNLLILGAFLVGLGATFVCWCCCAVSSMCSREEEQEDFERYYNLKIEKSRTHV